MFVTLINAQTISFKGCISMFEDQEFVFTKTGADETGRNIYITTPVDGAQSCGGLGFCEFKIQWDNVNSRWEFLADDNDGSFTTTNLIFYNSSASTPNPPGLALGNWIENISITSSSCSGNLTTSNATMTGEIQSTLLSNNHFTLESDVLIYPNPTNNAIKIKSESEIINVSIWNIQGKRVLFTEKTDVIDVSQLRTGTYFARIQTLEGIKVSKFIKE